MQFWRGFLAAILLIEMVLLLAVFVRFVPTYAQMVADFGDEVAQAPLFVLTTSRGWAIGCLAAMGAMAAAADRLTPTPRARVVALALATVVGTVLFAVTIVGVYTPIFQLAGNIR